MTRRTEVWDEAEVGERWSASMGCRGILDLKRRDRECARDRDGEPDADVEGPGSSEDEGSVDIARGVYIQDIQALSYNG